MPSDGTPGKKKPAFVSTLIDDEVQPGVSASGGGVTDNVTDSVNLFRRAKTFFPQVYEETKREREKVLRERQRRREQEEQERRRQSKTAAAEESLEDDAEISQKKPSSGSKRRKVSHEAASKNRRRNSTPLVIDDDDALRSSPSTSPEPLRRRKLDKGKGVQRPPTYNSARLTQKPAPVRRVIEDDDHSVIVLDDDDDDDDDNEVRPQPATVQALYDVDDDDDDDDDDEYERGLETEREAVKAADLEDSKESHAHEDLSDTGDPEFEEYIIRARARDAAARAAQAAKEEIEAVGGIQAVSAAQSRAAVGTPEGGGSELSVVSVSPPPPAAGEHNYRIFITPHFPKAVPPLVANVRMDQKMVHVQKAFLDHAQRKGVVLADDEAARVLLTWKGNKLYTWTTGQSLGIRPDRGGRFRDDGRDGGGGGGFMAGGLHLEIWTHALYEAFLVERERQRMRNLGEVVAEDLISSDEDEGPIDEDSGGGSGGGGSGGNRSQRPEGASGAAGNTAAAQAARPPRVRLVLKSHDYEKLHLTAYGDTKIAILVAAFREQRQIALAKTVFLVWDGERLDEDTTVADAEIEDMDTVEVYVR